MTDIELEALFNKYYKKLVVLAKRTLFAIVAEESEDAVQTAFMLLWTHRDWEITFLPAYLQQTVVNECMVRNRGMGQRRFTSGSQRNHSAFLAPDYPGDVHKGLKDVRSDAYTAVLSQQLIALCHPSQVLAWQHAFETGQHRFTHGSNTERSRFTRSKTLLRQIVSSSTV